MTPTQKHTLNTLLVNLIALIRDSTVPAETKGKAIAIVDFYLFNPFTMKEPTFFHLLHGTEFYANNMHVYYHPTHSHRADSAYVPLLTHMLKSNYATLEAELERLTMLKGLGLYDDKIPTAEQLKNRFVEGMALYDSIDHRDYAAVSWTLPRHVFGELPNATA
ncbi:hypothetical protein D3C85_622570 [compost metagenome]